MWAELLAGVPARFGDWDTVISGGKAVRRGWSVGSPGDLGRGQEGRLQWCSVATLGMRWGIGSVGTEHFFSNNEELEIRKRREWRIK